MRFEGSGYFDLAKEQAVTNTSDSAKIVEAKLRSAISMAYYAAFCMARNYQRDYLGDRELSNPLKKLKSEANYC